jgi:hypothetical protein
MSGGGRRAARARLKYRIVVLELLSWGFALIGTAGLGSDLEAAKILTR